MQGETNKDVMRKSAQVLAEKTTIPDGPNVAPSPLEHLAAQGVVAPAQHASAHSQGANSGQHASPADSEKPAHPDGSR